jgi:hypothetical protein
MRVLETIEAALAQRLANVQEPAAAAEPSPAAQTPLQALDERLAVLQAREGQAESDAAEADEALQAEAEAYQHWIESTTAARRRLADWAAGVK